MDVDGKKPERTCPATGIVISLSHRVDGGISRRRHRGRFRQRRGWRPVFLEFQRIRKRSRTDDGGIVCRIGVIGFGQGIVGVGLEAFRDGRLNAGGRWGPGRDLRWAPDAVTQTTIPVQPGRSLGLRRAVDGCGVGGIDPGVGSRDVSDLRAGRDGRSVDGVEGVRFSVDVGPGNPGSFR